MLFTMRGIPQIYYGTEIGLPGGNDHGLIRRDMPGGFSDDLTDIFKSRNINSKQKAILSLVKDLIKMRKKNLEFTLGKFCHFPPHNEILIFTYYLCSFSRCDAL